jgi:hypothetical protein
VDRERLVELAAPVHALKGDKDRAMADGHFPDVELLRRELAALILEWAGKAVKDDPDGPMSTALARAVGEAARAAVAEQHHALAEDAADRIAAALERRDGAGGRLRPWSLAIVAVAALALLAVAFLLGLQVGREGGAPPAAPATEAAAVPIAPLAPTVDEPAPVASTATPHAAARVKRPEPVAAKPASRPAPRELGRPAPASDEASSRSAQPVGAAAPAPAAPTASTPR